MILAGTGHRPDKLGFYKIPNPIYNYVCQQIEEILLQKKPDKIISGMALGFDSWLAYIACKLKIPFIAAIPFIGQEKAWPQHSQDIYYKLLKRASEQHVVCEGAYSAQKLQLRNEWMVNHCDLLLACFDGSSGGTANCINYAKQVNKEIILINPTLAQKS